MRIASVTLAGPGTEAIIGDALRSVVDEVDTCFVIDTSGVEADMEVGPVAAAREVVGTKLVCAGGEWVDDFAVMRNKALDLPWNGKPWGDNSFDWVLWLDTDERIIFQPAWRDALNTPACAVNAWHTSGEYAKERFIRLPRQGSYVGPTHEYFAPKKGRTVTETHLVTFDELPRDKDSPAWTAKLKRDIASLRTYTRTNHEARWLYYLGDSYFLAGETQRAINAWDRAVQGDGGGETEIRSWAAFRGAMAELARKRPDAALLTAMLGMRVHPHAPELFWAAAAASFDLGQYEKAICFAMHAGVAGRYNGWGRGTNRSAFVYPPAHWEGPLDILSLAYERLGRPDMALTARQEFAKAKSSREGQA